ncbi:MAG: helix-turn-helix domain-containing protein [Opitutaceae bacterium]|nr:helix-turn-helix domain-containing protein [Opitutaceae bacterium]
MSENVDCILSFPGRKTLTVGEIARVLRVSPDHVTNLIHDGTLGAFHLGRSINTRQTLRVSVEEFHRFMLCRVSSTSRNQHLEAMPQETLQGIASDIARILERRVV